MQIQCVRYSQFKRLIFFSFRSLKGAIIRTYLWYFLILTLYANMYTKYLFYFFQFSCFFFGEWFVWFIIFGKKMLLNHLALNNEHAIQIDGKISWPIFFTFSLIHLDDVVVIVAVLCRMYSSGWLLFSRIFVVY